MARHGLPRPGCLLAAALLLVSLLQFQWLDFTAWRSAERSSSSSRLVGWRWQPSVRGQLPAMRLGPGGGSDPVNNVSPEMAAAGRKYAQKYEDIMLAGQKVWQEMLKKDEVPKKIYFIGTNGNTGEMVAEALMDSLAYVPAPDGTLFLRRKPGVDYPKLKYYLLNGDKELAARAPKSPVDLYMEDEKKYRELETEVLKEFQNLETEGQPAGIIVGESAVSIPENVEILKTGLVIWLDVAAEFSWSKTQMRAKAGGGLFIPYEIIRPPVWCIANGWDGDIDDGEAKAEYMDMVEKYNEMYEEVADLRLRAAAAEAVSESRRGLVWAAIPPGTRASWGVVRRLLFSASSGLVLKVENEVAIEDLGPLLGLHAVGASPRQTAAFKAADTSGVVEELVLLFEEVPLVRGRAEGLLDVDVVALAPFLTANTSDAAQVAFYEEVQDRGDQGIPEDNAASKYSLSMRCKHYVLAAVRALSSFSFCHAIPLLALAHCTQPQKRRPTVEAGTRVGKAGCFDGPTVGVSSSGAASSGPAVDVAPPGAALSDGSAGGAASSVASGIRARFAAAFGFDAPAVHVVSGAPSGFNAPAVDVHAGEPLATRAEAGRMELREPMSALMSAADARSSAEPRRQDDRRWSGDIAKFLRKSVGWLHHSQCEPVNDTPGIVENQYWGAERLAKAMAELYGINTEGASVEEEVLERDLEKFLESARLSKYMQAALDWCDEQGAASIEDIVENTDDFAEALSLKPLEKKRLAKAAESVAAVA
ncbi:unnamed protein product [Symbiodinium microadriaticum]|nr:unnamed protein product [Symbiodinium microadriaticum]